MPKSSLELAFETYWIQCGGDIDSLESEYRFYSDRKWQFDYVHLHTKISIELEGGTWSGGRHVRGTGYRDDCEKYNRATLMGWRVFRFTTDMLEDDPWGCLTPIIEVINEKS